MSMHPTSKTSPLFQDFTGVPAVVDLACMRDAMNKLGSDSNKINPLVSIILLNRICVFYGLGILTSFRRISPSTPRPSYLKSGPLLRMRTRNF